MPIHGVDVRLAGRPHTSHFILLHLCHRTVDFAAAAPSGKSSIHVSLRVLHNVLLLARKFPHAWTALHFNVSPVILHLEVIANIALFVDDATASISLQVRMGCLQIFCILAASPNLIDNELWRIYWGVALVSLSLNQPMATSQALRLICTLAACSTELTPELFLSIEEEFPTARQTIMWLLQFLCGILCQTFRSKFHHLHCAISGQESHGRKFHVLPQDTAAVPFASDASAQEGVHIAVYFIQELPQWHGWDERCRKRS